MTYKQLIKQVADEIGWSQIDVQRAIDYSQENITTKDDIIRCVLYYSGPELKKRNSQLGAKQRTINQKGKMVERLIARLDNSHNFYTTQLIPVLKDTISKQAAHIIDLMDQVSGKNQGGKNG